MAKHHQTKTRMKKKKNGRNKQRLRNQSANSKNLFESIDMSRITPAKHTTFRKFRDNKAKKTPKRLQRKAQQFNDNLYLQKLVRSIKRRSGVKLTSPIDKQMMTARKSKSHLNKNRKSLMKPAAKQKLSFKDKPAVEEGQILSSEDEDGDCILVESTMAPIVIDDDEPSTSQFAATPALAMSTPYKAEWQTNAPQVFFKDTKRNPCLKYNTTNSTESPKYSKTLHKLTDRNECSIRSCDVVVLDEIGEVSFTDSTKTNFDDSVVFVSQQKTFVPLVANDVPNPIDVEPEQKKAPARLHNHSFFSASEQKALRTYNSNTYNPAGDFCDYRRDKKRTVLIDGSNVAYGHSRSKEFSVEGLKICIEYFDKMGHEVKAVVPQFRKNAYKSSNPELLEHLNQLGKIVFTPCKNLPGMVSISYDDRFVLQLACELDAAIISNDNYRDLIHESAAFKKLIENRVIGYTWCNDIFILPKDPYGRWGPTLDTILNRN